MTLLGAELALRRLVIIRLGVVAVVPGLGVLLLAGLAPACSLAWILGTVRGCYVLHMCLKDPTVTFPQISELGIGPRCSKALPGEKTSPVVFCVSIHERTIFR